MWRETLWVGALGTLVLVAGCQSSGVARRKTQSMEAYLALDAATRRLVDKGKIQNGMDTNAVFIAWGPPTDVFSVDIPGGQRLVWNYEEPWFYEGKRLVPRGSDRYGRPIYAVERWRVPITYLAKSVTFAGAKAIQWKKYDPPVLDQPPEKPRF